MAFMVRCTGRLRTPPSESNSVTCHVQTLEQDPTRHHVWPSHRPSSSGAVTGSPEPPLGTDQPPHYIVNVNVLQGSRPPTAPATGDTVRKTAMRRRARCWSPAPEAAPRAFAPRAHKVGGNACPTNSAGLASQTARRRTPPAPQKRMTRRITARHWHFSVPRRPQATGRAAASRDQPAASPAGISACQSAGRRSAEPISPPRRQVRRTQVRLNPAGPGRGGGDNLEQGHVCGRISSSRKAAKISPREILGLWQCSVCVRQCQLWYSHGWRGFPLLKFPPAK